MKCIKLQMGGILLLRIFIGDKHVGGYDDLKLIYENGELMRLIDE